MGDALDAHDIAAASTHLLLQHLPCLPLLFSFSDRQQTSIAIVSLPEDFLSPKQGSNEATYGHVMTQAP